MVCAQCRVCAVQTVPSGVHLVSKWCPSVIHSVSKWSQVVTKSSQVVSKWLPSYGQMVPNGHHLRHNVATRCVEWLPLILLQFLECMLLLRTNVILKSAESQIGRVAIRALCPYVDNYLQIYWIHFSVLNLPVTISLHIRCIPTENSSRYLLKEVHKKFSTFASFCLKVLLKFFLFHLSSSISGEIFCAPLSLIFLSDPCPTIVTDLLMTKDLVETWMFNQGVMRMLENLQ